MTKKMGRPKVPKSKALGEVFSGRLRPDEGKEVRAAIRQSGKSQSAWIREALLKAARAR